MPWIEFALLTLLVIHAALQPQMVAGSLRAFLSPIQRRYTDNNNYGLTYVMHTIFQLGVVSMTALSATHALLPHPQAITIAHFGYAVLLALAIGLCKELLDRMLQYIYQFDAHMPTYMMHKNLIWQVVSILCFAYLMLTPWLSDGATWIIPLCLGVIYIGIVVWKLVLMFGIDLEHLFFMLIYIVHAEILPLAVLAMGSYYILMY